MVKAHGEEREGEREGGRERERETHVVHFSTAVVECKKERKNGKRDGWVGGGGGAD